jgi:hypothetical protein
MEHHLHGPAAGYALATIREVAAHEQARALAWRRQSQDHPRDGRFARPAPARESEHFALGQLELTPVTALTSPFDPAE